MIDLRLEEKVSTDQKSILVGVFESSICLEKAEWNLQMKYEENEDGLIPYTWHGTS